MKQTVISVLSPSGGVGKSTITKELGIAVCSTKIEGSNIKTCIIDVNLNFGSQRSMLRSLPKHNIMDWVNEYRDDVQNLSFQEIEQKYDWDHIEKYLSYINEYNLYLLPAPDDGKYHDITTGELEIIIFTLKKYFDIILIDTGNNLDPVTVASIKLSNEALLIVTDEKRSIESVKRLRKRIRAEELPLKKFKVVMNRYPKRNSMRLFSKAEIEKILYIDVCSILPEEPKTWKYNNAGLPIVLDKDNKLKSGLLNLAHLLVPEVNPKQFKKQFTL